VSRFRLVPTSRTISTLRDEPRARTHALDAVGTTVWHHCDGDHTVAEIAAVVADTHDDERVEPVDETLAHFLMQLE